MNRLDTVASWLLTSVSSADSQPYSVTRSDDSPTITVKFHEVLAADAAGAAQAQPKVKAVMIIRNEDKRRITSKPLQYKRTKR